MVGRKLAMAGLALLVVLVAAGVAWLRPDLSGPAAGPGSPTGRPRPMGRAIDGTVSPRVRHGAPEHAEAPPAPPAPPAADTPERVIRGSVVDRIGDPIEEAAVALVRVEPCGRKVGGIDVIDFARNLATAMSAADGTFEMTASTADRLVIVARKAGYATGSAFVEDDRSTDVRLSPGEMREFVVVDESGNPIPGAQLWLFRGWSRPVQEVATSDAGGRARLALPDECGVHVHARGFVSETNVDRRGDDDRLIRVILREGRSIAGVVVDGQGSPLGGVPVSMQRELSDERHEVRSAADGTFVFDGIDPHPTEWVASAERDGWAGDTVAVLPGGTDARLVLWRAGVVRGVTVQADGTPAPYVLVKCGDSSTTSEIDGRFVMTRVPAGPRVLKAVTMFGAVPALRGTAEIVVPEGGAAGDVRLVMSPPGDSSYVLVRVVDAVGRPMRSVAGTAWATDGGGGDTWAPTTRIAFAAAWGRLESGRELVHLNLRPGTGVVLAAASPGDHREAACTETTVATQRGPPYDLVELRLGARSRIRLRLVDPSGRDVAFEDDQVLGHGSVGEGTFEVPPGLPFSALVRVPGHATRLLQFDPPHPALREETVQLSSPACLTGRVLSRDGSPAVACLVVSRETSSGLEKFTAVSGGDGRVTFDALAPGAWNLRVVDGEELLALRTLDVGAGTIDWGELWLTERLVRGEVTDTRGDGVGGAGVVVELPQPDRFFQARPVATTTRTDGSFEVRRAAVPTARLRVSRRGSGTVVLDLSSGAQQPLSVVLEPAGCVCVALPARAIGAGPRRVEARRAGTSLWWEPHEAERGGLVYNDLPPGAVDVRLTCGSREATRRVEVVAGRTVECSFE